jgi:hypothetical protein
VEDTPALEAPSSVLYTSFMPVTVLCKLWNCSGPLLTLFTGCSHTL